MKVLFLDLETSGFDPKDGEILECHAVSYDVATCTRGSIFNAVINWPEEVLEKIWSNHTKSGLKEDCRQSTLHWLTFVQKFNEYLGREFGPTAAVRLAGFSPQFDYNWLKSKMLFGDTRFSHRLFDVSTIRDWLKACSFGSFLPDSSKNVVAHRAREDVEVAIKTLELARVVLRGE